MLSCGPTRKYVSRAGVLCVPALACLLVLAGFARAEDAGAITGKVTLKGGKDAAAPRGPIDMSGKADCAKLHTNPVLTETEIVGAGGELKNVLVSIKAGLGDRKFAPPTEPAKLDQKGCKYVPHVFGMMAGQKLHVANTDDTEHNVNFQPNKNERFNQMQPRQGQPIERVFKRPEIFPVKCDVHPWMSAWCGVFEHPFFAVTDKDGNFTIKDVPPGEYTLQFWHEVYPPRELKVTVKAGAEAEAELVMDPKK